MYYLEICNLSLISDFSLCSTWFVCKRLHGSHTGEYIQQFEEVVASFETQHKVGHAITDNASNIQSF